MIVVVGGTGILGTELKKVDNDIIGLSSQYDIYDFKKLQNKLLEIKPEIIINCAIIKSQKVDENPIESIDVNIIGTCNLSKFCIINNIRLVYISTDYVYDGKSGNFKETDPLNPVNNYAWTKLSAEGAVKLVPNHLIVRTSFGVNEFPYQEAYENLYSSKDYLDIIAPMIYDVSTSNLTGTINIGTERKSLFDFANRRNEIPKGTLPFQKDFSLDTTKYKKFLNEKRQNFITGSKQPENC